MCILLHFLFVHFPEIELVSSQSVEQKVYDSSKYESCIKIKGKPILPPLMTEEKREQCYKWRQNAIDVEKRLAEKRKDKYMQSIDRLQASQASMHSTTTAPVPSTLESRPISSSSTADVPKEEDDAPSKRERKNSYTLEEPSPMLLAYLQRFGDVDHPKESFPACDNPQCHLEDYLTSLSQAPKIVSLRHTPVSEILDSPGKENVAPIENQEEQSPPVMNPLLSPLKLNEGPTWANKSPQMTPEKEPKIQSSAEQSEPLKITEEKLNTPVKEISVQTERVCVNPIEIEPDHVEDIPKVEVQTNLEPQYSDRIPLPSTTLSETPTKERSVQATFEPAISVAEVDLPTPRSEAAPNSIVTVDSSLLESVSLPTMKEKEMPRTLPSKKEQIEAAISALAVKQQNEIKRLIEHQAKEREQLRLMFENQQRELINSVLSAVSTVPTEDTGVMADLESNLASARTDSTLTPFANPRITSPVIPTVKVKIDPASLVLPQDYHLPDAARTPENNVRFEKLSALVKGHLVRRLMKTEKVQGIIQAMEDITKIALQLHREAHQFPKMEDVQLHARLLHQLQRECQSFHEIFFKYSPQQRMSIIRLDRELKADKEAKGFTEDKGLAKKKRISAVTMAKLQQKEQVMELLSEKASRDSNSNFSTPTKSPYSKKLFKTSNARTMSLSSNTRRALKFGNDRTSTASVSSPRSGSRLSGVRVSKMRRAGVKSITNVVHSKPWK